MKARSEGRGARGVGRGAWGWLAVLALLLAGARGAEAQQPVAVFSEPGTTVVATEVLIATGRVGEQEPPPGLAYLAARAVIAPILPQLDSLGAQLTLRVAKDAISFSLVAAPDAWEAASRLLLLALFRDPVEGSAIERERRAIRAELTGREASPVDVLTRETDAAVFGPDHPWGRSEVGYASSIGQLAPAAVDSMLRDGFTPERSVLAVVGPADAGPASRHLLSHFEEAPREIPRTEPPRPADSMVQRRYDSITTWISASYRFHATADLEALRLLAYLVEQALTFGPLQRDIYDTQVQVLPWPGGGELRLQVAVPPVGSERWAERVREAVARFAAQTLPAEEFRPLLRGYRGQRLLELSSPEARAREAARTLFVNGTAATLPELDELSPTRLRQAARSLQEPVMVLLGPFVGEEGEEG